VKKPALSLDYSKVFLTYVSLLGHVDQTAQACDLAPEQVSDLAARDNWDAKVRTLLSVKEKQGAEAFARELNRTANFVQALRCRNLLDQTIQFLTNGGGIEPGSGQAISFGDFMTHKGSKGETNVTAKNLADLMKSVETIHRMTYAALGDTAGERPKAPKSDVEEADDNPSLSMVRALASLNATATPGPTQLFGTDDESPDE